MKFARLIGLLAALLVAIGVGVISTRRADDQTSVREACGAVENGDWNTALRLTEGLELNGAAERSLAECRCMALLSTGRSEVCEASMDRLLADPAAADWSPGARLAVHLIQTRRSQGRSHDAAKLAIRAARAHPQDGDLFYLELATRVGLENEAQVMRELESRIDPDGPNATRMRVSLATRHLIRSDSDAALEVLGVGPPTGPRNAVERWYDTRGMALAQAGDLGGVKRTYAGWAMAGGNADELSARYALTLSIAGLSDPDHTTVSLLERAIERTDGVLSDNLTEAVVTRLILTLVVSDRQRDALATYDAYRDRFEMSGLVREELERSQVHELLAASDTAPRATIRFSLPSPPVGAELWLSPGPAEPVDAAYEILPVPGTGLVETRRAIGTAPQRWVYRSPQGTLASGTAGLSPGQTIEIRVEPRPPKPPQAGSLARRPGAGDGNRRVFLIILDCADWRLVQYLRARGELPTLDALLNRGFRAVLDSDPPLTAAALEALVWPERSGSTSFIGLVHQMGVELAGLASVGDNPFDALSWILPENTDLFASVGAGRHTAANLLFSHGGIRAGRHSEITGPDGKRRRLPLQTSERDLRAAERERWPGLLAATAERDAVQLRTIAAQFDTAERIAAEGEIDFLALRIEGLDILTHAFFGHTVRDGQDDGDHFLFELYRYIDARLAQTLRRLDSDDVLIAMSDHGIRTSMEHSRHAIFVADGAGVPTGRAPGRPALRGVSAVVADLMGVETQWPRTGVAPWARAEIAGSVVTSAEPSAAGTSTAR